MDEEGLNIMSSSLIIAMPLVGAALPIIVTQMSHDRELRAVGRSVVKYAIVLPLALVVIVIGLVQVIN